MNINIDMDEATKQEILAGVQPPQDVQDDTYVAITADIASLETQSFLDAQYKQLHEAIAVDATTNATSAMSIEEALNSTTPNVDHVSYEGNSLSPEFKRIAQIYGNNAFQLEVENSILIGVLSKLPPLGITSDWTENALTDAVSTLAKNVESNAMLQTINSILGVPQIPFVAGGASTTRMYKGCSLQSFNLQFRIYSLEPIGPLAGMTGYKRFIAALCLYTPALHTMDPASMVATIAVNLGRTIDAGLQVLNGTIESGNQVLADKLDSDVQPPTTDESKNTAAFLRNAWDGTRNFGNAVFSAIGADNEVARRDSLKKAVEAGENAINGLQNVLVDDKYALNDMQRVQSPINYYKGMFGGALWNLSIYPGILKHKIPVYIDNWSITPSKEIDRDGNAAYVDFNIHCTMDQIKTGTWWSDNIYAPESDAYKNLYKKKVKEPD